MGNYEELKKAVSDVIKTNGKQEITGAILQNALLSIISTVGSNSTFAGLATPTTNPGTPDQNVFYLASEKGFYSNFGGVELTDQLLIFTNKNGNWVKQDLGIATYLKVSELEKNIELQKDEVNEARDKAIEEIENKEQSVITNFNSQRVTPEMLSESTKQLIEASGGGTITNLPDDEDLESVNDGTGSQVIKFKNREYNPVNFIGKGYKILRKNIIDGKNILSQDMINNPNTIYNIIYDFDLNGSEIKLPIGCVINFDGGTIKNGLLISNKTILLGNYNIDSLYGIFYNNEKKPLNIDYLNKDMNLQRIYTIDRKIEQLFSDKNIFPQGVIIGENYIYLGILIGTNYDGALAVFDKNTFEYKGKYYLKNSYYGQGGIYRNNKIYLCPALMNGDIKGIRVYNLEWKNYEDTLEPEIIKLDGFEEYYIMDIDFDEDTQEYYIGAMESASSELTNIITDESFKIKYHSTTSIQYLYNIIPQYRCTIQPGVYKHGIYMMTCPITATGGYYYSIPGATYVIAYINCMTGEYLNFTFGSLQNPVEEVECSKQYDKNKYLFVTISEYGINFYLANSDFDLLPTKSNYHYAKYTSQEYYIDNSYKGYCIGTSSMPYRSIKEALINSDERVDVTLRVKKTSTPYTEYDTLVIDNFKNLKITRWGDTNPVINISMNVYNSRLDISNIDYSLEDYFITGKSHNLIINITNCNFSSSLKNQTSIINLYNYTGHIVKLNNCSFSNYNIIIANIVSSIINLKNISGNNNKRLFSGEYNNVGSGYTFPEGVFKSGVLCKDVFIDGLGSGMGMMYCPSNYTQFKSNFFGTNNTPKGGKCLVALDSDDSYLSKGIYYLSAAGLFNIDGSKAYKKKGNTSERPIASPGNEEGFFISNGGNFYDTTLGKPIWYNGTKYIDSFGNGADIKYAGTFDEKPLSDDIKVGYSYFCKDRQTIEGLSNGIMIYYKGNNIWVDALGRVVE